MASGRQRGSGAWHGGRAERNWGSLTHKVGSGYGHEGRISAMPAGEQTRWREPRAKLRGGAGG